MFAEPTINDFIFKIRWHLWQRLTNAKSKVAEAHSDAAKRVVGASSFRQLAMEDYIDKKLREFDEVLEFKIRQFDVGFFDSQEPEVPHMANTINIGTMTGSAIQQGSPHAKQAVQMTLNVEAVRDALAAFEAAIQGINLSENVRTEIIADINTIRAQLAKPSPNVNILKEAGKSVRNVLEGIAAGLMTPAVTTAASARARRGLRSHADLPSSCSPC
jgi:hypothetical protein